MKAIFSILFTLLSLNLMGQSTINFVFVSTGKIPLTLYLNDRNVGTVGSKENLEYKIHSKGRISVIGLYGSYRYTGFIDVSSEGIYYFDLYPGKFKMVDEERGKTLLAKTENTIKIEEDKQNPLVRGSIADEDKGPKQGTCFLIGSQGYLLTNHHVISGAKSVQIKGIGNDFTTLYAADVIAFDIDLDLALLKLKNQNITFEAVPYGLSKETNSQGTKSFVLGFPLTSAMGEEIKVTEGIISAKSGYKGTISQYQFSAAIQPGNSGSPLFNENGDVIGVINAKLQGAEGAGYAIKSQHVSSFLDLIENVQIENNKTSTSNLSLSDKISKLRNNVFIVKSE